MPMFSYDKLTFNLARFTAYTVKRLTASLLLFALIFEVYWAFALTTYFISLFSVNPMPRWFGISFAAMNLVCLLLATFAGWRLLKTKQSTI
jgi:hypothetical protein